MAAVTVCYSLFERQFLPHHYHRYRYRLSPQDPLQNADTRFLNIWRRPPEVKRREYHLLLTLKKTCAASYEALSPIDQAFQLRDNITENRSV